VTDTLIVRVRAMKFRPCLQGVSRCWVRMAAQRWLSVGRAGLAVDYRWTLFGGLIGIDSRSQVAFTVVFEYFSKKEILPGFQDRFV